ncbi:LysR family transcriptional regulator [Cupriavidus sp. IDO]|uniref:LysR family transcriptional regulator n=1 Tax=Cupriavidus sp. IDO TaxID=1539142 RepID=UPI0009E2BDD9|nr:LysR family transcriptional regulator [Cupriavidus sp. IDO]
MNSRLLGSFILVVQLGSFRAAADKLHITQATISNRIGPTDNSHLYRVAAAESLYRTS